MNQEKLSYPQKGFTPLVIESYRKINHNGIQYHRRLRMSRYNALLIDEILNTYIGRQTTEFVVLDLPDIEKACQILEIEYKPINTYFKIDSNLCSYRTVPNLSKN